MNCYFKLHDSSIDNSPRNSGVDLARTVAIIGVVLVHSTGLWFGRFGVQLFFVVSGYLLADYQQKRRPSLFLMHRFFRLFPLSIIFITLFYTDDLSLSDLLLNLGLINNLWWQIPQYPGGWSISSEWLFSLLLVLLGKIYRKKIYYLIALAAILSIVLGAFVYLQGGVDYYLNTPEQNLLRVWLNTFNPLINSGFFLLGIGIKRKFIYLNRGHVQYFYIAIICIMITLDKLIGHLLIGWMIAIPIVFMYCLKFQSNNSWFGNLISFIGNRTYGIFFVHFLLLDKTAFIPLFLSNIGATDSALLVKILSFLFIFIVSIIGGAITYTTIEKPFLKISRSLETRFNFW